MISRAGGGALPMCDIPTFVTKVSFVRGTALDCDRHLISKRDLPVIGRLSHDALLFDARTLLNTEEYKEVALGLAEYFETLE